MSGAGVVEPTDWYATLPMPSLSGDVGGELGVVLRAFSGTHATMEKPALTDDVICLHQGGPKLVHRWESAVHQCWNVAQDTISLLPRFRANRWLTEGPIAFTHLTLSGGLLARMACEEFDRDPRDLAIADQVGILDPLVVELLETLANIVREAMPGRLYQESLLTALTIRVLMRYSSMSGPRPPVQARGGLAGWQLRRVIDYMAAHLADDIGAAVLLQHVSLSRAQLFRGFRQSTGQTPGRYLLSLRVQRAQHLLATPDNTLEEISRAVGFDNADSFARAFKRVVGVSPAVWRQRSRR